MDEIEFSKFYSCISPGDFIGVTGFPGLCCCSTVDFVPLHGYL